jgi:hypothetical protein
MKFNPTDCLEVTQLDGVVLNPIDDTIFAVSDLITLNAKFKAFFVQERRGEPLGGDRDIPIIFWKPTPTKAERTPALIALAAKALVEFEKRDWIDLPQLAAEDYMMLTEAWGVPLKVTTIPAQTTPGHASGQANLTDEARYVFSPR